MLRRHRKVLWSRTEESFCLFRGVLYRTGGESESRLVGEQGGTRSVDGPDEHQGGGTTVEDRNVYVERNRLYGKGRKKQTEQE